MKPLFLEKVNLQAKISLVEEKNALSDPEISSEVEQVISHARKSAATFNSFL